MQHINEHQQIIIWYRLDIPVKRRFLIYLFSLMCLYILKQDIKDYVSLFANTSCFALAGLFFCLAIQWGAYKAKDLCVLLVVL